MQIREFLKSGQPLLFDGAMGTYFAQKTRAASLRCELANLSYPQVVEDIHREYLAAGCRAIKTNTFAASRPNLDGDETLARQVIETGCRIARAAAQEHGAFVFADIGPVPAAEGADCAAEFCWLAERFLEQGVDGFLFETQSSDDGLIEAVRHIRTRSRDAYIIVSFAVQPDGYTREGLSGEELFLRMATAPEIDAVGFNCVSGAQHLLDYLRSLPHTGKPVSIMPNAGYPTVIRNRTYFNSRPDYFAAQMAEIYQAGAVILGGCCGTTPAHIRKTAEVLRAARKSADRARATPAPETAPEQPVLSDNAFWNKVLAGERVVAVELDPPLTPQIDKFLQGAKTLQAAGVDILTIADCPVGRARIDSSLLACKLHRELGLDTLPHLTCRDRNLNATKALLLGLHVEGIRNVLAVTGDPIPSADRDEVKSVFNFNSRRLARYISTLNETVFPTPLRIFGALNLNALNFGVQLRLAQEKVENGVSMFLTQPVLTEAALENLARAREALDAKILGGIIPVVSYRNACFLNNEVSGIRVSERILSLYEDKDKEACRALAVELSVEIAKKIEPYVDGLYLMTPFGRVDIICEILDRLREMEA